MGIWEISPLPVVTDGPFFVDWCRKDMKADFLACKLDEVPTDGATGLKNSHLCVMVKSEQENFNPSEVPDLRLPPLMRALLQDVVESQSGWLGGRDSQSWENFLSTDQTTLQCALCRNLSEAGLVPAMWERPCEVTGIYCIRSYKQGPADELCLACVVFLNFWIN